MSAAQARRIAIAAGSLDGSVPGERGRTGARTLERMIERLGLLQLDSVNVFERSHYLPLFSRLGPYDRRLRIQHAHVEPAAADRAREHATQIAPVLQDAARWQGLGDIALAGAGTWAGQIARALS